jgi:phosphatidylinositol alpha-1,6-mannosyltransferase
VARADRILLLDEAGSVSPPPTPSEQRLARRSQPRFVWQLWRAYRRHRPDLVLFDLLGLGRALWLPLPGFPPSRYAVFVHGIELEGTRAGTRARVLRGADRILTNSAFTARAVARLLPELEARIRVTPLCIDPERAAAWEAQPLPPRARRPAALIVARMVSLERGKGHDELLAAWPAVRRSVCGAELWIVGGGDDRTRYEAKARDLGIADSVRFFGRISDAELGALYAEASVFAMPSRQEGFGLVYAEAMWHGLACLGSHADAAGELIEHGTTGLLVPYGDAASTAQALTALLGDPERTARMGAAGRQRALERFSYPRFKRDLLDALFGS